MHTQSVRPFVQSSSCRVRKGSVKRDVPVRNEALADCVDV